jgi:hypothetical protein
MSSDLTAEIEDNSEINQRAREELNRLLTNYDTLTNLNRKSDQR